MKAENLAGSSNVGKRAGNDFYKTPPHATISLLKRERFSGSIWEPACGDGAISKVLYDYGYDDIFSSDLIDRGYGMAGLDFLKADRKVDNVVTNPPYSLAEKFVRHAWKLTKEKVALLLKLNFLEGQKRYHLFRELPPARIYVFSRRLSFEGKGMADKGRGLLCFAWMIWQHGHTGLPTLDWICE